MEYTYKLLADNPFTQETSPCILRIEDGALIPKDEANTDYQEYLEWVAEGNTPEEAE